MKENKLIKLPNYKDVIKLTKQEILDYENLKNDDSIFKDIPSIFYSILDKAIYGDNAMLIHLLSDGLHSSFSFHNTAKGVLVNEELIDSYDKNKLLTSAIEEFLMIFVLNRDLFDSLDEEEKEIDELSFLIYVLENKDDYKEVSAVHIKGDKVSLVPTEELEKMCKEDQNVIPKTEKTIHYSLYKMETI